MRLDILPIRKAVGEAVSFDYMLALSELDLYGERPIPEPVHVSGFAQNRADVYELHMDVEFTLRTRCARCLRELEIPLSYHVERPMADEVENEDENDEIILLESGVVDLDEIATETIVLEADMSYLCDEDCPGLCPTCGADLNEGPCGCNKPVDERFAALAELLEKGK
ncbi:MAG: DUF177 domain-containing protein [Ruminococcaceae bacterium]|nr:DUF177 domain-containing protein [Oscillospiraceae bacterium]